LCPRFFAVNERDHLAIHVLAIETDHDGLIVVDSGLGNLAVERPSLIPRPFRFMARPRLSREVTALGRIEALGFSASDVRHIAVTHLDLDHAGGLRDFPGAVVHVHARELEAARFPRTFAEKHRYLGYQIEGVEMVPYEDAGDDWHGFAAVRSLQGVDADVALIPMFGHSRGHSAIAVRDGDRWLLHAGDAYFHHSELADPPRGTGPLNAFQKLAQVDGRMRLENRDRLGALARERAGEVEVFCAHDPVELERYSS
jgi:glyoxylase-like metal-dependent hydrolase (beta-lactamase superfamily II)